MVDHGDCYEGDLDSRIFPYFAASDDRNTPEFCKDQCASYDFAGLQNGKDCWCGDDLPEISRKTSKSECNKDCPGDASKSCGGENRMQIYRVNNQGKLEISKTEP